MLAVVIRRQGLLQETGNNGIYSGHEERRRHVPCRAVHAAARGDWTKKRLAATERGETQEHGGVACVRVDLPEVNRSGFEKTKSKGG